MPVRLTVIACVGVLLLLAGWGAQQRSSAARAVTGEGPLRFAPDVSAADRATVLGVVAAARPLARALVERVDGMVLVHNGVPPGGAAGMTEGSPSRGYDVTIDLAGVARGGGQRAVTRVVLHELAHVVDHALVDPALAATMDRATPVGWGCDDGNSGACAAREERFAESFAKWASGDAGVDVWIGYRVPPPDLERWGLPLAPLLAAEPRR